MFFILSTAPLALSGRLLLPSSENIIYTLSKSVSRLLAKRLPWIRTGLWFVLSTTTLTQRRKRDIGILRPCIAKIYRLGKRNNIFMHVRTTSMSYSHRHHQTPSAPAVPVTLSHRFGTSRGRNTNSCFCRDPQSQIQLACFCSCSEGMLSVSWFQDLGGKYY